MTEPGGTCELPGISLEMGGEISPLHVAYEAYGRLNSAGDNAILICHALTGNARAADGPTGEGWWGPLIGPGRPFDTDRFYVICSNVLGGCGGTTGPNSAMPNSNDRYGSSFPVVTIRDMVRVQKALLDRLGVGRLHAVVGGSMGGMQALEWALVYPDFCERVGVVAADVSFSTMGIAYNQVMREAIVSDPEWREGAYWRYGTSPTSGLRVARMLGMITYRTAQLFAERFGRDVGGKGPLDWQVGRYLRYQGDKLVARFDANTYLTLMTAMDLHDIGRDRGGVDEAWRTVTAQVWMVGIEDDLLYPPSSLQASLDRARAGGVRARYVHIDSRFGHDAFLLEWDQMDTWIRRFLNTSAPVWGMDDEYLRQEDEG